MFGWIAAGAGAAVVAATIASAAHLEPAAIVPSAAAAITVAVVFALRPAAGIGAFLVLVLVVHTLQEWLGADLRFYDELTVTLLFALSAARNWSWIVRLRPGWKEAALVMALSAGVVSSLVSAVPTDTWVPALALLVKGIAFFYAVSWLRLGLSEVEGVATVLLATAGVILALGFVELVNPIAFQQALRLPSFTESRGGIGVVKSLFLHPGLFGWFMAFAGLFLYARFMIFRQWWALAAALVLSAGTLLSGRRRPVLGILAALAVGVVWLWRRVRAPRARLKVIAPLVAALAMLAVLTWPAISGFYTRTVTEYLGAGDVREILSPQPDEALIAGAHPRVALYVGSLAIARDFFPLGAGLGRFGSYMSQAHYSPIYERYGLVRVSGLSPQDSAAITDTFWPMVLGELGPFGLAGMVAFFALLLARLWRAASQASAPGTQALALGACFVFVEGLVGSLTAATYVAPPIAYFVFAAAAAAVAVQRAEADLETALRP